MDESFPREESSAENYTFLKKPKRMSLSTCILCLLYPSTMNGSIYVDIISIKNALNPGKKKGDSEENYSVIREY